MRITEFILYAVLCSLGRCYDPNDRPVVILRIDDVVTFFCEDAGLAAINAVINTKTPISVGIIAHGLRANKPLSRALAKLARNDYVEIMHHSYLHDDYTGNTYEWQMNDLLQGEDEIEVVTGRRPTTFAPPRNTYDDTTISVLRDHPELNLLSAQCSWRRDATGVPLFCNEGSAVVAPNISYEGLYMLPTGAVMGAAPYFKDFLEPASLEDAVGWMEAQIANQGFSVLMLHPLEFSKDETCTQIDEEKLSVLLEVIAYGQDKWQFMSFQQALEYYTGVKPDNDKFYHTKKKDTGSGTSAAEMTFAFALGVIMTVAVVSCCCSFSHPTRAKLVSYMFVKSEPDPPPSPASPPPRSPQVGNGSVQMKNTKYRPIQEQVSPLMRKV